MKLARRLAPILVIAVSFAYAAGGEESAYRLTVHDGQEGTGSARTVRAEFCLEPVGEGRAEVCLGAMKGYELWGAGWGVSEFTLAPGADGRCVCYRPVTLDSHEKLCWPEWIEVSGLAGRRLELSGFVTLLEGAHEPGDSTDTCVRVDSENKVQLIKRAKPSI